jgi:nicotinamide-nucleotide amidase
LFEVVLKKPIIERNLKQADVPDNCKVIFNKRGSAPGMWFEQNGKIFISMPGVPHEMKGMMTDDVIPALAKHFTFPHIAHRTLLTIGVGESFLADLIIDFENALPAHIKLAYLPNFGLVRLRLSGSGSSKDIIDEELNSLFSRLQQLVQPYMVTNKDESMEEVLGRLLLNKKKTMCTAESCTGGYIAHLVTSRPGSSAYYEGSIVSYSYKAKENLLQVDEQHLKEQGAVSEIVVREMAAGALHKIKSDYAIAVSGIMGPGGGMPGKPVGTVWIAAGNDKRLVSRKFNLRFDRQRNIQITAVNALNMLREFILEDE